MKIYIGSDHAGFELKQKLTPFIKNLGYEVEDFGAYQLDENDDYPDFIIPVAEAVSKDSSSKGIILGGSGQGEVITANRFSNIRAVVYYGGDNSIVRLSREHNNANIFSLGARFVGESEAKETVKLWLETPFSNAERHIRRLKKIDKYDEFDKWNNIKRTIDSKKEIVFFKERDIFYIKTGKNIGFEESGKGEKFARPVLVVKKFNNDVFWGIPLSTTKKRGKYYFPFSFISGQESVAILSQMRLFDAKRLMDKIGIIDKINYGQVKQKIATFL